MVNSDKLTPIYFKKTDLFSMSYIDTKCSQVCSIRHFTDLFEVTNKGEGHSDVCKNLIEPIGYISIFHPNSIAHL